MVIKNGVGKCSANVDTVFAPETQHPFDCPSGLREILFVERVAESELDCRALDIPAEPRSWRKQKLEASFCLLAA